ncbi:sugar ABC transporter substrate-binding protein [Nocardiopsis sinuspersici]|uniref:Sugar ABC transporter substrate-binding protein n=1 Tax=Nocardiopsis sinuspersici TaxID=501010 RepID=A0A1V3C3K4_9ACTN|nr:sugar ABC transporter substrate-binding protein [Nocardiopsis sinuspersici]
MACRSGPCVRRGHSARTTWFAGVPNNPVPSASGTESHHSDPGSSTIPSSPKLNTTPHTSTSRSVPPRSAIRPRSGPTRAMPRVKAPVTSPARV